MLKTVRWCVQRGLRTIAARSPTTSELASVKDSGQNADMENELEVAPQRTSVLDPISEDISHIGSYLKPTFNLAAYANRSEVIQEFVKLGVNLYYIEKKISEAVPLILRLKFEDLREHVLFLNSLGVSFEDVGKLITKNPLIFKEKLEDLKVRVNYLKFKRFNDEMIARIVAKNPYWLSYSTHEIDHKLGFFQKNFKLNGNEVRSVAVQKPQLITFEQQHITENTFVLKEEMGFADEELKSIILAKPHIFMQGKFRLQKSFEYVHNVMGISHEQILQNSEILTCRASRMRERHQFLVKLKRDQFNAKEPNYVNLVTMVKDPDGVFATEVAKSSAEAYNMFLKTL
ncbi:transcription termination factor 3, mitochondrial [Dendroctonus ponderosae]|uniref:Uncharacterized protein n=1 Tax=Dendroctonus ponderosae TaxID=77166 RepID=J3JY19_DENPD|nr:transcription termination factor 3, mitochondrial [Dendroctonus ponderosae]AEE63103.1 unknown [Dendroctonus ponderosae]ERL92381.1 hypothetical protein D910_09695 [Dendroctonus ponderosae]KAH1002970.1 hypothetical protein HUJ04_008990 [Dendroctonus ponderosae]KAH1008976.1 hypothetical protein HUJ05_009462 [Dendroctonus ponderosae]